MRQVAFVGIHTRPHQIGIGLIDIRIGQVFHHEFMAAGTHVAVPVFHRAPKELHPLLLPLQINLLGMKRQEQTLIKQPLLGIIHKIKVIHIPPVMLHLKHTLNVLVKLIQVDITEQRRSKVANGKAAERQAGRTHIQLRSTSAIPHYCMSSNHMKL